MQVTSDETVTIGQRCRAALPYLVVFAVGAFLYYSAANFEFEEASGRIGPGAWPKLVLLVMLAAALWGMVVSALQSGKANGTATHERTEQDESWLRCSPASSACLVGFFWIRVVVKVLTIPQGVLSAIVVMFCLVGAYANRNDMSDVWMIVIFGVLGYLFDKFKFPISPMVLGAILGPIGETAFMRSMISSGGDWTVLFRGPISGTLMAGSLLALSYPLLREFLAVCRCTAAVAIPGDHR